LKKEERGILNQIKREKNMIDKMANFPKALRRDIKSNKAIYLMAIPVVLYYVIFRYGPMYGSLIAFKDFTPSAGILGSEWVGFRHFNSFFHNPFFWRLLRNTVLLSFYNILFGFPAPIVLALLINEISNNRFKKTVQTVTYMPHFISIMVICGMIIDFTSKNGVVNDFIAMLGFERSSLLLRPELFRLIYVSTDIWQQVGWGSIVYLAALAGIDVQLYEAAIIDGANRWKQTIHVTLPGIMPTIIILFILRIGRMMNISFEKIILLYNPLTYETADVITSYVYRKGILEASFSYSTAIGLFNMMINFILLLATNKLSKRLSETSLW
jgi:putative aldouronate transport system permease protein